MSMIPVSNGPIEHNNRSKLRGIDLDGAHLPATGVIMPGVLKNTLGKVEKWPRPFLPWENFRIFIFVRSKHH